MIFADVCLAKAADGRPPGWVPSGQQSCRAAVSMVDGGVHGQVQRIRNKYRFENEIW